MSKSVSLKEYEVVAAVASRCPLGLRASEALGARDQITGRAESEHV